MFRKFTIVVLLISFGHVFGQTLDKDKAWKSVEKYMSSKYKGYKSIGFGELFVQNYPDEMEKAIKTKKDVKYSIIHIYTLNDTKYQDYLHMDKDYKVLGLMTFSEMMIASWPVYMQNAKFAKTIDSLGVDTNNIKFEEKK